MVKLVRCSLLSPPARKESVYAVDYLGLGERANGDCKYIFLTLFYASSSYFCASLSYYNLSCLTKVLFMNEC